eukprot:Nk52_evm3s236 gene=Nk52_evmTU3s236
MADSWVSQNQQEAYEPIVKDSSWFSGSCSDFSGASYVDGHRVADYAPSSVYSWDNEEEYDRQATSTVKVMFEQIDHLLYNDAFGETKEFSKPSSIALCDEIGQWSKQFPHLRICGQRSCLPTDYGVEAIITDDCYKENLNEDKAECQKVSNANELCVVGRQHVMLMDKRNVNFAKEEYVGEFPLEEAKEIPLSCTVIHRDGSVSAALSNLVEGDLDTDWICYDTVDQQGLTLHDRKIYLGLNDCGAGSLEGVLSSLEDKEISNALYFVLRLERGKKVVEKPKKDESDGDLIAKPQENSTEKVEKVTLLVLVSYIPKNLGVHRTYRKSVVKHLCGLIEGFQIYEYTAQKREDFTLEKIMMNKRPAQGVNFYILNVGGDSIKVSEKEEPFCNNIPIREEYITTDGTIDEFYAFDQTVEDDGNGEQAADRTPLPPVNVDDCIREQILSSIFQSIWYEICPFMRPLLRTVVEIAEKQNLHRTIHHAKIECANHESHFQNDEKYLEDAMVIHSKVLQKRKIASRASSPLQDAFLSEYNNVLAIEGEPNETKGGRGSVKSMSTSSRPFSVNTGYINLMNSAFAARPKPSVLLSKNMVKGTRNSIKLMPIDHNYMFSPSQDPANSFHHSTKLRAHLQGTSVSKRHLNVPASLQTPIYRTVEDPNPQVLGKWNFRPVSVQSRLPPLSHDYLSSLPSLTAHYNPVYEPSGPLLQTHCEETSTTQKRSGTRGRVRSGGSQDKGKSGHLSGAGSRSHTFSPHSMNKSNSNAGSFGAENRPFGSVSGKAERPSSYTSGKP